MTNQLKNSSPLSDATQPVSPYATRVIYGYTLPNSLNHEGLVKIGDTTIPVDPNSRIKTPLQAATKRIAEQNNTAGNETKIEFAIAIENDDTNTIRDHQIHEILIRNGYPRVEFAHSSAREWFKISPQEAENIIRNYIQGSYRVDSVPERTLVLRPEQVRFRDNAYEAYVAGDKERLWNAKMRFGKTTVAHSFFRKIWDEDVDKKPLRVIVISHRPVVETGWYEDFSFVFPASTHQAWQYSSRSHGTPWNKLNQSEPFIYFASMQDLRGKDDSAFFKKTNNDIFSTKWDIVVVDESHEGNDTGLASEVHESLQRDFTLYLSGTPFKQLASERFPADAIDSWDYVEEQQAKESWDENDGPNPYAPLPKVWINTYDLSKNAPVAYSNASGVLSFDFNRFWEIGKDGKFIDELNIEKFLQQLIQKDNKGKMPYGPSSREFLRHGLWVLPSVRACKALKNLMETHPYFKDYSVLNVAGTEEKETQEPLVALRKAIGSNPLKTKTITLTVGRLTTGVSVPEWSVVLLLSNIISLEFYMQTIFRVQTPHTYNGQIKTDCFVYDFAPDRVLQIVHQVAGATAKAGENNTTETMEKLGMFLNYLPITAIAGPESMVRFTADSIIRELKAVYSEKVTKQGFDSPLLFVKDLSSLTADERKAIEQIRNDSSTALQSMRDPINHKILIGPDNSKFGKMTNNELEVERKKVAKPANAKEKKQLEEIKKVKQERDNIVRILRTLGVRIPYIVFGLMADNEFRVRKLRNNFELREFVDIVDQKSWKEFFGGVTKETFLILEPLFDKFVLQTSVTSWIKDIENTAKFIEQGDSIGYLIAMQDMLARLKNPNKETVLTPFDAVELVYKELGLGFGDTLWEQQGNKTFYDVNSKTAGFALNALINLVASHPDKTLEEIRENNIFTNARTISASLVTQTVLGVSTSAQLIKGKNGEEATVRNTWDNNTTIDVEALRKSLEAWNTLKADAKPQGWVKIDNIHKTVSLILALANVGFMRQQQNLPIAGAGVLKIATPEWCHELQQNVDKLTEQADMSQVMKILEKIELADKVLAENADILSFDFVVTNPPYQENLVAATSKAVPLWPNFLIASSYLGKKIAIIAPARWMKGGSGTGLLPIKKWIEENKNLKSITVFPKSEDVFPTASIAGGVDIKVFDNKLVSDNPIIRQYENGEFTPYEPYLISEGLDIYLEASDRRIVENIVRIGYNSVSSGLYLGGKSYHTIVAPPKQDGGAIMGRRPEKESSYFIEEDCKVEGVDYVKVFYVDQKLKRQYKWLPLSEFVDVPSNSERIPFYKVMIPKTGGYLLYRNMPEVALPYEIGTNVWLSRVFSTKMEAENYQTYVKTYFYRYLVALRIVSHIALINVHKFVPDLADIINPRTGLKGYESDWTDDDLRVVFAHVLTEEDWLYIKAKAVEADGGRGDYEAGWAFKDGSTHYSLTPLDTPLMNQVDEAIAAQGRKYSDVLANMKKHPTLNASEIADLAESDTARDYVLNSVKILNYAREGIIGWTGLSLARDVVKFLRNLLKNDMTLELEQFFSWRLKTLEEQICNLENELAGSDPAGEDVV